MVNPSVRPFAICFLAAFLAAGIPWWLAPYNRFTFSSPAAILGCLAFVVIAAWSAGWTPLGLGLGALATGSAVPAAVMARVIVDVARDATTHNLWPLELVFMAVPGFALAFAAGLVGRFLHRLLGPG